MIQERRRVRIILVRVLLIAVIFLCCVHGAYANGVSIDNIDIDSQDEVNNILTIKFDIFWENSWRDQYGNRDAVWVFMKWYSFDDTKWYPARVMADKVLNPTEIDLGVDGDVDGESDSIRVLVPLDRVGFIIERSTQEKGEMDRRNIKVQWKYDDDGLHDDTKARKSVHIMMVAIEMVYAEEGEFWIGDGNGTAESEKAWHEYKDGSAIDNQAVKVTVDSKKITYDGAAGTYDISGPDGIPLNDSYPTGYKSFYYMKYEISQHQFVHFLNSLTKNQQRSRVPFPIDNMTGAVYYGGSDPSQRQGIRVFSWGGGTSNSRAQHFVCNLNNELSGGIFHDNYWDEDSDGLWVAMNCLSFGDLAAYADWSGLRPMTELEYEKACRGPCEPVYGEYAWGTTNLTQALTIVNAGQSHERVSEEGKGLCRIILPQMWSGGSLNGESPLRCGFAAPESNMDREDCGASYYGAMDMSGNCTELTVALKNTSTFNYVLHGDGKLDVNGNADVPGWPSTNTDVVIKGGGMESGTELMQQVSYRGRGSPANLTIRYGSVGGRLVRSNPYDS